MDLRSSSNRLLIVAALLALWTGSAVARLGYLQLFRYSDFLARAQHQQHRVLDISAKRADILDRNLQPLAMSAAVDSCFAVPSEIADPQMVARLLAPILGTSAHDLAVKLGASHSFVWIARKLEPETTARIEALNLKGVYFQKEDQRFYPKRELAAGVLGYVDVDEKGLGGIEYGLDDRIRSKPGRMLLLEDAHSRMYDTSGTSPTAGSTVVLTLDENIQYIAEKELDEAIRETHAESGSVVVQDPSNGEILAMASWPTFNPNLRSAGTVATRMNRPISALYEPGSVFKIVTLSAAIDQGLITADSLVDCQMGAIYIAGKRIRDHHPYGTMTVAQILAKSSDVGAIKVGLKLGPGKLYDYIKAYGFGSPTNIDLPGESRGLLRPLSRWTAPSVGYISMGQEVGVTPVQVITAMSAIANGGLLYRPHVVKELRKGDQETPVDQPAPRRVIQETTAATMRAMLEGVVLGGTATRAQLDGYTTAGKTGTAQKMDPLTHRYSSTKLIASFAGFAPINNPAVTILVQLDSPVGEHEGGSVAAPVFKRIGEQVLAYLNVPHDIPLPAKTLRASGQAPINGADDDDVADYTPHQSDLPVVDDADNPQASVEASSESQTQTSASAAPAANPAAAASAGPSGDSVAVPSLSGKTVREAAQICEQLGLNPVLVGTGLVQDQQPEAGAEVPSGSAITLRFGRAGRNPTAKPGSGSGSAAKGPRPAALSPAPKPAKQSRQS